MKTSNKYIGDLGESIAEIYLSSIGYKILEQNFRCRIGEVDIIGKDKNFLCFIEVKTRKSKKYGLPGEAVNHRKKVKIYKAANIYILKNKLYNCNFRFDIVEIMLNTNYNTHNIRLIKNAFHL
ncbi:YraN family protein [Clostridium sp. LBM24168]